MRFAKLHLARFGMFTDEELQLSPDGVNLIVGSNEAGKSTTRAAIAQFLYGIPLRSPYDWVHKKADMRIGATVLDESGVALELYRAKRATSSLRTANDEPLDDDVLRVLLSGVSEDLFTQLFSMGHDDISSGGASLLSNGGEVGVALFGAGSGLTTLNQVLASLANRSTELFKSGGSNPKINAAVAEFKRLQTEVKEASQSAADVEKLRKQLERSRKDLADRDALLSSVAAALVKAERVHRSRPKVLARQDEIRQLQELLDSGSRVDSSMPTVFDQAVEDRRSASVTASGLESDIRGLDEQLGDLSVDEVLLGEAIHIAALTKEIGGLRQNFEDLPGLQKKVGDLERELAGLLDRVPSGCVRNEVGLPTASDVDITRLRRLVTDRSVLDPQVNTQVQARAESAAKAADARDALNELAAPCDIAVLAAVIERVRREGALESSLGQAIAEATSKEAEIQSMLGSVRITVAARSADGVALPDAGKVSELDTETSKCRLALETAQQACAKIDESLTSARLELDALIRDAAPPTAEELLAERTDRDRGWQLVRAAWLGPAADEQEQLWTSGRPLAEAYEAAVSAADLVADRMLRDAASVERRASLERDIERMKSDLERADGDVATKTAALADAEAGWSQLWVRLGLEPSDRSAMDVLLSVCQNAGQGARTLRQLDERINKLTTDVASARADVLAALRELGDDPSLELSLVALLERGEQRCKKESDLASRRSLLEAEAKSAEKAAAAAEQKLKEVTDDLAQWQTSWEQATSVVGLAADTDVRDVDSFLVTLDKITLKNTDLDVNRRRVVGIELRNEDVADRVAAVLSRLVHLHVRGDSTASKIEELNGLLASAEKREAQRRTLLSQVESKRKRLAETTALVSTANASIKQLCVEAGMADEDHLREAVERTKLLLRHEEAIVQFDRDVLALAQVPIAQIEAEVAELADADLEAMIETLSNQRDEHSSACRALGVDIGAFESQLRQIDESSKAAVAAAKSQEVLAELSSHAEEYMRVMLAKHLLEQEIELYRERNQGPILGRASELFGRLTVGRYVSIDTDDGARGSTVLLAKNKAGSLTDVANLSTGARDQLYLALRLAAIEHVAAAGRSVPLVLDDLFVHFDDERTQAGLRVLDELSSAVQVLLFTHHESVAEQAKAVLASDRLNVQRLGTGR